MQKSNLNNISKFLIETPGQWGLRGDPYLWEELKEITTNMQVPASKAELEILLHELFEELIGEKPVKGKNIFVARFSKGGMSSGMICCDFWLGKGFPIIIQRFTDYQKR